MAVVRPVIPVGVNAVMPLRPSVHGVSGAFLVLASDNERYWCKPLNNFDRVRVPVTDQIVGRLGGLIAAPVCPVELVRLDDLAGWEFRPGSGRYVEPGWAHGSRAVDPSLETRSLDRRAENDNRVRHAGIYALCDWLLGGDVQWLFAPEEDNAFYSHDHGYYLGQPDWDARTLRLLHHESMALSIPAAGLDEAELERIAERLEGMLTGEIEAAVAALPAEWPVSDEELAAVVETVDARRAPVAARLRRLKT